MATLLAALHPADRRWLLARVDAPARERLTVDVKALLRLPPHARRLPPEIRPREPVAADVAMPLAEGSPSPEAALIAQIDAVPGDRMTVLWSGAPDWLLSAFLRLHPWRQAAALQRLLPPRKIESVPQAIAPAARQALLEAVWKALQASGAGPTVLPTR